LKEPLFFPSPAMSSPPSTAEATSSSSGNGSSPTIQTTMLQDTHVTNPIHIRTRKEWSNHQQTCMPRKDAEMLLEELFIQTGENLIGEMGLWTCKTCQCTAHLMVRANVTTPSHRASTPCSDDMATGIAKPENDDMSMAVEQEAMFPRFVTLGAYFTPRGDPADNYTGHHPGCRRLM
jgi:hypothetical protein